MTWVPADRLRALLGESIQEGSTDADTFFSDIQIANLLSQADNNMNRAAFEGWRMKAAHYASLVNVVEGNAARQMSDLHKHATDMMKHFSTASDSNVSGRTRIGNIRRR